MDLRSPDDSATYLAEHYLYERDMLHGTHEMILRECPPLIQNALIESFCLHARALLDFYDPKTASGKRLNGSGPKEDDVVASCFFKNGFEAAPLDEVFVDIRDRVNKQIAHLTMKRIGARKINGADRLALLKVLDAYHAAFVAALDPQLAAALDPAAAVVATGETTTMVDMRAGGAG